MTELTLVAPSAWAAGLLEAFALRRPDLRVAVASEPADPGWSSADVVWWGAFQPPGVAPRTSLPLDRLTAEEGLDLKPFAKFADLERAGGHLHALPVGYGVPALLYNLDIFEQWGTPPPPQDLTWAGMVALAEDLRKTGAPVPFGDGAYGWAAAFLAWQGGADHRDPHALFPFVEMVRDLRRRAGVPSSPEWFGDGRTAMAINDCGAEAMSASPTLRWGVSPFPSLAAQGPSRARWRRSHAYVHLRSKHPKESFALAAFIPRWAAERGPAVLGTFAALDRGEVASGSLSQMPVGQEALRAAAQAAAPDEWDAGAPFADGALWAALEAAIGEGWDLDTFAARFESVQMAAPT